MAKGKKHREDEILKVLKEVESGASVASVARARGIADQTISRWREKHGGMQSSELKEPRELQAQNQRRKRIVARQALEIDACQEGAEGKW